jgi:CDP-diacylglycerol--glycerol-3-phosphate 3-phosphatidyltransferase
MNIANKLTIARIVLVPVFIVFFYLGDPITGKWFWTYVSALVFIAAALTDLFDGRLARKHGIVTNFGKLADPIADKLLVCSALILLCERGWIWGVFVIIMVGREFIISGFRLVAAADGLVLAADKLGKAKTVVQIVAIVALLLRQGIFITPMFIELPIFEDLLYWFGEALVWGSVILSVWSCVNYFVKNKPVLKNMF